MTQKTRTGVIIGHPGRYPIKEIIKVSDEYNSRKDARCRLTVTTDPMELLCLCTDKTNKILVHPELLGHSVIRNIDYVKRIRPDIFNVGFHANIRPNAQINLYGNFTTKLGEGYRNESALIDFITSDQLLGALRSKDKSELPTPEEMEWFYGNLPKDWK